MVENDGQSREDPVVLRLLVVVAAALSFALVDLAVGSGQPSATEGVLRLTPWPMSPGAHLASAGCIEPRDATAADWRQVVGVNRRTAPLLVAHCNRADRGPGAEETTRGNCGVRTDFKALRGIGARTARRIIAAICPP